MSGLRQALQYQMSENLWPSPPAEVTLSYNEVHVWRALLDLPDTHAQQLVQTLSEDERTRANHFRFPRDRNRFIVAHGTLRVILGRYLGIKPGQVRFEYGPRGKPCLAKHGNAAGLLFSMAHSNDMALLAFTVGRQIGVDLEYTRPLADADQIAASVFSARERLIFHNLSMTQQQEAFYSCWCIKEAYLKATGDGLTCPPDEVEVLLGGDTSARLMAVRGDITEASRWFLQTFKTAPDCMAAVVVEGQPPNLRWWLFENY